MEHRDDGLTKNLPPKDPESFFGCLDARELLEIGISNCGSAKQWEREYGLNFLRVLRERMDFDNIIDEAMARCVINKYRDILA